MKDITHYFSDLPKKGNNAAIALKEVKIERAKIDDTANTVNEESKSKKKRGRVKIKISRKSNQDTICDIVESSTDLVDKTPSPYPLNKALHVQSDNDTPKGKNTLKSSFTNKKDELLRVGKRNKSKGHSDVKEHLNESTPTNCNGIVTSEDKTVHTEPDKTIEIVKELVSKKTDKNKEKHTKKLIELANKKGYSKRKIEEEEESVIIEERIQKRKKLFTEVPDKNSNMTQTDENTVKNDCNNTKRPGNLLNYFSKATPEQIEKERIKKAKVTVKAEIHSPQQLHNIVNSVPEKKVTDSLNKKLKSDKEKPLEQYDEICLLQSEIVVLSPKNEKLKTPTSQTKPKWSLKIQFQKDTNINVSGSMDDENENIFSPKKPVKSQKENSKNSDKIPKILLPMKSKKADLSNSYSDDDSMKRKEKKNVKVNNDDELKTESKKTGSIKMLDKSCDSNNVNNKQESIDDCQIVENVTLKRKSQEKLAPLFTKKIKPNPEIVAARRLFLQSDSQETNNSCETRKVEPTGPITLPFPKISHINQLSSKNDNSSETFNYTLKNNSKLEISFNVSHMKTISKLNDAISNSKDVYKCIKSDIETVLSEIKNYCTDGQQLWNSISMVSKLENNNHTPKLRRKSLDKKKQLNDNSKNVLLNSPWTDKYKPKNCEEVVGNEEAVMKLKTWLSSWKSFKNTEDYSSSEEFYNSDCSTSSSRDNQVAVLIGPHGCGKTASVYAVAQEFGYKVLEVNASSKRPGKKILKEFEEATKSHRVKKSDLKDMFITKKSKENKIEETQTISQNSLILMEDIDIVFEEDEGFISAAFQLATNTKRPIVMTLTETCSHLSKMAPHQLRIHFQPATGKRVSALLQLITLAETGCKLPQNCIDALCESGDIRQGILQLQYILLSGKEKITPTVLAVNNSLWKDMKLHIYKPAIKAGKNKKKKQTTSNKSSKEKNVINDNILDNLVNNLDSFSLVSLLTNIDDPTSQSYVTKCEPNISVDENLMLYSNLENIGLEIGSWLNNAITKQPTLNISKNIDVNCHLQTKKQINNGVDRALSRIASNTLDHRALAVDYLSSIRTICRAEEIRNQVNSKRGNRFFHYLQSSRLSCGTAKPGNILSAACKMLQENHQ